jgi:hypothetical protein
MLEHPALWLSAPHTRGRGGAVARLVYAATGRAPLGQVGEHFWRWWPWPVRSGLTVTEGPDRSALFAVRRAGWLPHGWDVFDADGRLVALLRGAYLMAPGGGVVGMAQRRPGWAGGVCVGPGGLDLAAWRPDGPGLCVEFRDCVRDEPFVKMALLTVALLT